MGRRMVTSFEGGILLLEGPRLSVKEYRDSFGGIAVQKGSCAMPKSAKVLRKVWAALPRVEELSPRATIYVEIFVYLINSPSASILFVSILLTTGSATERTGVELAR